MCCCHLGKKIIERRKAMSAKRQGTDWTKADVSVLRKQYRNNSTSEVARMLQRTPKAVERKASKLGLTKTKKYLRSVLNRDV